MSNTINASGKDFIDFWKRAAEKGELKPNTARTIGVSCAQVLQCTENWEILDMRTLNLDDAFRRFLNKRGKDLKSASLSSYKNRLKNGINMFLDYANDPSAWKPQFKSRLPSQERKLSQPISKDDPINIIPQNQPTVSEQWKLSPSTPFIEYPFPLREGQLAYLKLPTDLKTVEVKRLTTYLNSLTVDSGCYND